MAITSLDTLIAGLIAPVDVLKTSATGEAAGELFSSFYTAGSPGAAAAPSPGIAGLALTSYAGQLTFPAAVASQYPYLAGLDVEQGGGVGSVWLCDRLWHNSGIAVTTTTSQTVNSVTWAPRDRAASTDGDGILVGIEVSTATTNGSAVTNTTLSYTNSASTAGRTATIASFPATAVAGTFVPFNLAAGDKGIQSIASITLGTSYGGGAIHLVAYRLIARVGTPNTGISYPLTAGTPRRMWDSSVPFLLYRLTGTSIGAVSATVQYAQG